MKRHILQIMMGTALVAAYAILIGPLAGALWMSATASHQPNALFGTLPATPLFREIPNVVAYLILGAILSRAIARRQVAILAACLVATLLQFALHRWQFTDAATVPLKLATVLPPCFAPWTAWIGVLIASRTKRDANPASHGT